jgi:hypothetical protein
MTKENTFLSPRRVGDIPLISCDADPLADKDLSTIEAAIGCLPSDYRQFLLSSNGGRIADDEVRFVSARDNDSYYVTAFSVLESEFPPEILQPTIRGETYHLLQIAHGYDSPFLMRINGQNAGAVFYWNYSLEERWDADDAGHHYLPNESSLQELAPTFTEFVNQLVRITDSRIPQLAVLERSVENFAKYGDSFFDETKAFFDTLSIDELNDRWPKDAEFAVQPIYYSARWAQVRTTEYLIHRGVDIHTAVRSCTNNFRIAQMLIRAGATEDDLRQLLRVAATGIGSTRVPEEHYKIVIHLLEMGVRPNFVDASEMERWLIGVNQIYTKKILSFLLSEIEFPDRIAELIRGRLGKAQ